MQNPTTQQRAVLDAIGKNTTVSAGAGAGKTGVMVERHLEIVRRSRDGSLPEDLRVGVDGILTITFTDDAASELKQRLVKRLDQLKMRDERRQVETAYISTIHGFCTRLLKENPFEAGLDPQFSVLARGENALLQEAAFSGMVEDGFRDGQPEIVELFRAFSTARRFGDSGIDPISLLRREAIAVCDLLRSQGWRQDQLQVWLNEGQEGILAANMDLVVQGVNGILDDLSQRVERMERLPLGIDCALETARCGFVNRQALLTPLPVGLLPEGVDERLQGLWAMRPLAGKTSCPSKANPLAAVELKELFRGIAALMDGQKKLLSTFDAQFERESAQHAFWLLRLASRLWEGHGLLKRNAGRLDYNDLQAFARDLLQSSPQVLEYYRDRLRHLMVDEFQDTDGLQKQILDLLAAGRHTLFCVGDPKQSIYGFRHADVTIFGDLVRAVRDGDSRTNTHLVMNENFRCRPEIITLVNHVFSTVGAGAGIEYEPLVSRAAYGPRREPSIELLLAPAKDRQDGGGDEGEGRSQEAELVAKRIRQMIDDGKLSITAEGERQGTALQQKDFLILLRSFTPLGDYERALAKHGIDYYIVGGRGYYALREIRDLLNILKVIQNPLDDVALAATLRSPFCGLSDEALYALARMGRESHPHSLHTGVLAALAEATTVADTDLADTLHPSIPLSSTDTHLPLNSADLRRLKPFWCLVEQMRRKEDRTPISSILEELLAETLYEARLLLQPWGRRKMANVRKLIASASARDTAGVSDFIHWLGQQRRVEEKEGEAPTEEEAADVVRIRTIHNAKGLESNVVILGGLSRNMLNTMQRPAFLFDRKSGAGGCQYPHPESFKSQASAAYAVLAGAQEQKDLDESLRLLYVAMTRAREYLILAGSYPATTKTWAGRILPCLGVNAAPEEDITLEPASGLQIIVRSKVPGHRLQATPTRQAMERIQTLMKDGERVTDEDLENLRNLMRS